MVIYMSGHPVHALIDKLTSSAFRNIELAMKPIVEAEGEEDLDLFLRNVTFGLQQLSDADCMCRVSPDQERVVCMPKIEETRSKIVEELAKTGIF